MFQYLSFPRSNNNTTCDKATAVTNNGSTGTSAAGDVDAYIDVELALNADNDTDMPMALLFLSQCNYEEKISFDDIVDDQIEDGAKADDNTTATDTDPADAGNVVDAANTNAVAATDIDETDDADMNIAATSDAI